MFLMYLKLALMLSFFLLTYSIWGLYINIFVYGECYDELMIEDIAVSLFNNLFMAGAFITNNVMIELIRYTYNKSAHAALLVYLITIFIYLSVMYIEQELHPNYYGSRSHLAIPIILRLLPIFVVYNKTKLRKHYY